MQSPKQRLRDTENKKTNLLKVDSSEQELVINEEMDIGSEPIISEGGDKLNMQLSGAHTRQQSEFGGPVSYSTNEWIENEVYGRLSDFSFHQNNGNYQLKQELNEKVSPQLYRIGQWQKYRQCVGLVN